MCDSLLVNVFNLDTALLSGCARQIFADRDLDVITPNSTDPMRGLRKRSWPIVSAAFENVRSWSGREGAEIVAITQVVQEISKAFMRGGRWIGFRDREGGRR